MAKRIASILLCICLLFSAALPVSAKTKKETEERSALKYTISNVNAFLDLAEKCRLDSFSENLVVSLQTDLDLTNVDFEGIPVFCGTFEGNGHTIQGLTIQEEGSVQGLFRYLADTALVQNLKVTGTVHPTGSRSEIGGIAGNNAGRILNCSFTGEVSGNEYIGGIAGINTVSGIVENCTMEGSVYGNHFVGGVAGKNSGVIRNSENKAQINDTAVENNVELSDITIDSLTGSESVNTVTDIGGIAGSSVGVIRDCVNRGQVGYQHMGYNIGGIAGTQSGAIIDCENHGKIQGRKEVGGIVGQMEPTALIEYEEDALQILQKQLSSMGSTVSATVSNVQGTSNTIMYQVGILQDHVWNARDAVDTLIPDRENPSLPDLDTIQAAQNTISSSMSGMSQTLQGMGSTAYNAMGAMSTNLYAMQNQINAMRSTLGNISQTLGGSITDVSDKDTEEDLTGKVSSCANYGSILADLNAGGIAGAMAMENDLDHEEDWDLVGDNSLNFESELRAVITSCSNAAQVTCKKQNGGGIVGWQSMGLVRDSLNSGKLDAEGADYVGGISGQSNGFIRNSSARCELLGSTYVGGIAGSATIVTDCRSMVLLSHGMEKIGEILGDAQEPYLETKDPVHGNLYLSVGQDKGGIDGISYAGKTEAMTKDAFLALDALPEMFQNVTIRFTYKNGQQRSFTVPLGGEFDTQWIPPIPPKSGYVAVWQGMDEDSFSEVMYDMTFELEYSSKTSVLQSAQTDGAKPVLLLQGVFQETAELILEKAEAEIALENKEHLLEVWAFTVSGAETLTEARIRIPNETENYRVLLRGEDGQWRSAEYAEDGSYAVFALQKGDSGIALVQTETIHVLIPVVTGTAAMLLILLLFRKRKRK